MHSVEDLFDEYERHSQQAPAGSPPSINDPFIDADDVLVDYSLADQRIATRHGYALHPKGQSIGPADISF